MPSCVISLFFLPFLFDSRRFYGNFLCAAKFRISPRLEELNRAEEYEEKRRECSEEVHIHFGNYKSGTVIYLFKLLNKKIIN